MSAASSRVWHFPLLWDCLFYGIALRASRRKVLVRKATHMARKQKFDYFDGFVKLSEYAVQYADELVKYMEKNADMVKEGRDPSSDYAIERFQELHKLETEADSVRHSIVDHLSTEFLAPIEREDIMAISSELDDLVDYLDEILQHMYMYDIHVLTPSIIEMMKLAHKATVAVNEAVKQFPNFKKASVVRPYLIAIDDVEEEADGVYIRAMHDVFVAARKNGRERLSAAVKSLEKSDSEGSSYSVAIQELQASALDSGFAGVEALGAAQMLSTLEHVCDACESIGVTLATTIMKNS